MMTGYLLTAGGGRIDLPPFTAWKLKRTESVPCDSFEGRCIWDSGLEPLLESAYRLIMEADGARRFTGLLDEYELGWGEAGGELLLSGRGLAALLLDNEAEGQDYQVATLADILHDHVEPYGIQVSYIASFPPVPDFSVETGASEWQVLYDFARYHGGIQPRFDVWGNLFVDGAVRGQRLTIDDRSGVTGVRWRDRRYGVYSEILVRDRGRLGTQRLVNEDFARQGGRCRRVITMPGKSAYQAMRYSGQFQLDRSAEERFRVEVKLPGSWFCEPGDRVELALTRPALTGTWTVRETEAVMDGSGTGVKLTLG